MNMWRNLIEFNSAFESICTTNWRKVIEISRITLPKLCLKSLDFEIKLHYLFIRFLYKIKRKTKKNMKDLRNLFITENFHQNALKLQYHHGALKNTPKRVKAKPKHQLLKVTKAPHFVCTSITAFLPPKRHKFVIDKWPEFFFPIHGSSVFFVVLNLIKYS